MKRLLICFITSLLLLSCSSSGGLAIPGEDAKFKNNISYEYYQIAEGYYGLKNYQKAGEYYVLASKNKEYNLSCKYKLARCYAMNKNWAEAEKLYNELLSLDSENVDIRLSLAYIYAMNNESEKALELYKELSLKYPENQAILENCVCLLMSLERNDEAKEPFKILNEKFPDSKIVSKYADTLKEKSEDGDKKEGLEPDNMPEPTPDLPQ